MSLLNIYSSDNSNFENRIIGQDEVVSQLTPAVLRNFSSSDLKLICNSSIKRFRNPLLTEVHSKIWERGEYIYLIEAWKIDRFLFEETISFAGPDFAFVFFGWMFSNKGIFELSREIFIGYESHRLYDIACCWRKNPLEAMVKFFSVSSQEVKKTVGEYLQGISYFTEKSLFPGEKILSHMFGDSFIGASSLQGGSIKNNLEYILKFFDARKNSGESLSPIVLSPAHGQLLRGMLEIEVAFASQKPVGELIVSKLKSKGEVLLAGGWRGKTSAHAVLYHIKKVGEYYQFTIINSGEGLSHHKRRICGTREKFCPEYTIKGVDSFRMENSEFFNRLMLFMDQEKGVKKNFYEANQVYDYIGCYLGGEVVDYSSRPFSDFITEQRAGTCSWKSLMAFFHIHLPRSDYLRFKLQLRQTALFFYCLENVHFKFSRLLELCVRKHVLSLSSCHLKGLITERDLMLSLDISHHVNHSKMHASNLYDEELSLKPSLYSTSSHPFGTSNINYNFILEPSEYWMEIDVVTMNKTNVFAVNDLFRECRSETLLSSLRAFEGIFSYLDPSSKKEGIKILFSQFVKMLPSIKDNDFFEGVPEGHVEEILASLHRILNLFVSNGVETAESCVCAYYVATFSLKVFASKNKGHVWSLPHCMSSAFIQFLSDLRIFDPCIMKMCQEVEDCFKGMRNVLDIFKKDGYNCYSITIPEKDDDAVNVYIDELLDKLENEDLKVRYKSNRRLLMKNHFEAERTIFPLAFHSLLEIIMMAHLGVSKEISYYFLFEEATSKCYFFISSNNQYFEKTTWDRVLEIRKSSAEIKEPHFSSELFKIRDQKALVVLATLEFFIENIDLLEKEEYRGIFLSSIFGYHPLMCGDRIFHTSFIHEYFSHNRQLLETLLAKIINHFWDKAIGSKDVQTLIFLLSIELRANEQIQSHSQIPISYQGFLLPFELSDLLNPQNISTPLISCLAERSLLIGTDRQQILFYILLGKTFSQIDKDPSNDKYYFKYFEYTACYEELFREASPLAQETLNAMYTQIISVLFQEHLPVAGWKKEDSFFVRNGEYLFNTYTGELEYEQCRLVSIKKIFQGSNAIRYLGDEIKSMDVVRYIRKNEIYDYEALDFSFMLSIDDYLEVSIGVNYLKRMIRGKVLEKFSDIPKYPSYLFVESNEEDLLPPPGIPHYAVDFLHSRLFSMFLSTRYSRWIAGDNTSGECFIVEKDGKEIYLFSWGDSECQFQDLKEDSYWRKPILSDPDLLTRGFDNFNAKAVSTTCFIKNDGESAAIHLHQYNLKFRFIFGVEKALYYSSEFPGYYLDFSFQYNGTPIQGHLLLKNEKGNRLLLIPKILPSSEEASDHLLGGKLVYRTAKKLSDQLEYIVYESSNGGNQSYSSHFKSDIPGYLHLAHFLIINRAYNLAFIYLHKAYSNGSSVKERAKLKEMIYSNYGIIEPNLLAVLMQVSWLFLSGFKNDIKSFESSIQANILGLLRKYITVIDQIDPSLQLTSRQFYLLKKIFPTCFNDRLVSKYVSPSVEYERYPFVSLKEMLKKSHSLALALKSRPKIYIEKFRGYRFHVPEIPPLQVDYKDGIKIFFKQAFLYNFSQILQARLSQNMEELSKIAAMIPFYPFEQTTLGEEAFSFEFLMLAANPNGPLEWELTDRQRQELSSGSEKPLLDLFFGKIEETEKILLEKKRKIDLLKVVSGPSEQRNDIFTKKGTVIEEGKVPPRTRYDGIDPFIARLNAASQNRQQSSSSVPQNDLRKRKHGEIEGGNREPVNRKKTSSSEERAVVKSTPTELNTFIASKACCQKVSFPISGAIAAYREANSLLPFQEKILSTLESTFVRNMALGKEKRWVDIADFKSLKTSINFALKNVSESYDRMKAILDRIDRQMTAGDAEIIRILRENHHIDRNLIFDQQLFLWLINQRDECRNSAIREYVSNFLKERIHLSALKKASVLCRKLINANVVPNSQEMFFEQKTLMELIESLYYPGDSSLQLQNIMRFFELSHGIILKAEQIELLMKTNRVTKQAFQLGCGFGKTSVVTPLLNLYARQQGFIPLNIFPKSNLTTNIAQLREALIPLEHYVDHFPFDRSKPLAVEIYHVYLQFLEAFKYQKSITTDPESIHSIILKYLEEIYEKSLKDFVGPLIDVGVVESLIANQMEYTESVYSKERKLETFSEKLRSYGSDKENASIDLMEELLSLLFENTYSIIDESHIAFKETQQVNFTLKKPLRQAAMHWEVPEAIFKCLPEGYVIDDEYHQKEKIKISHRLCDKMGYQADRNNFIAYMTAVSEQLSESERSKCLAWIKGQGKRKEELELARAHLNVYLPKALGSGYNVNYGRSKDPQVEEAIPYDYNMVPSLRNMFENFDLTVNYTLLMLLKEGLTEQQLVRLVGQHIKQHQTQWISLENSNDVTQVQTYFQQKFPEIPIGNILLSDPETIEKLMDKLSLDRDLIFEYCRSFLFPSIKVYQHKLESNAPDLSIFKKTITFSGTPSNAHTYPVDLPCQMNDETEIKVFQMLLNSRICQLKVVDEKAFSITLRMEKPDVVIDSYHRLEGITNRQVADTIIGANLDGVERVVYFSNTTDSIVSIGRDGRETPIPNSPIAKNTVVFIDESHVNGADFQLVRDAKGLLLINRNMTYTSFSQGAQRMRLLGKGQTITFAIGKLLAREIMEKMNVSELTNETLVLWLLLNESEQSQKTILSSHLKLVRNVFRKRVLHNLIKVKDLKENAELKIGIRVVLFKKYFELLVSEIDQKEYQSIASLEMPVEQKVKFNSYYTECLEKFGSILTAEDETQLQEIKQRADELLAENIFSSREGELENTAVKEQQSIVENQQHNIRERLSSCGDSDIVTAIQTSAFCAFISKRGPDYFDSLTNKVTLLSLNKIFSGIPLVSIYATNQFLGLSHSKNMKSSFEVSGEFRDQMQLINKIRYVIHASVLKNGKMREKFIIVNDAEMEMMRQFVYHPDISKQYRLITYNINLFSIAGRNWSHMNERVEEESVRETFIKLALLNGKNMGINNSNKMHFVQWLKSGGNPQLAVETIRKMFKYRVSRKESSSIVEFDPILQEVFKAAAE